MNNMLQRVKMIHCMTITRTLLHNIHALKDDNVRYRGHVCTELTLINTGSAYSLKGLKSSLLSFVSPFTGNTFFHIKKKKKKKKKTEPFKQTSI